MINNYYRLSEEQKVDKNSELVTKLKKWVDAQYEDGRVTVISDEELIAAIEQYSQELNIIL